MVKTWSGRLLALALATVSFSSLAADPAVEQRLQRLEKLMNSQVLMDQNQQMQQIRQDLADLRGMVEDQGHELELIKQRQRNLYQDMDRRIHDLEVGGSSGSAPRSSANTAGAVSSVAPPVAAPTTAPPATAPAAATAPPAADQDGKLAYSQAFNLLKEGRYQQAIIAFRQFLENHPQSKYADNAQYWLGEANYVSRDYKTALAEFRKLLANYPDSSKAQGAELKVGYTYYEMKDWANARSALEQLVKKYPNSTISRKAEERLQRMKREGH